VPSGREQLTKKASARRERAGRLSASVSYEGRARLSSNSEKAS
jgi:hypothetical protein